MSDRAIIEAANKMTGQHKVDQVTYVNAVIDSVDMVNRVCSCTAIDGHTEYQLPTVKLMASVDDGFLIEPEIGSTVKVLFSQNIEPFVVQYSGIKNITIFASTAVQFQDGTFGGLVKVSDLVTKLNALENDLNALKTALVTAIVATPTMVALTPYTSQLFTQTMQSELENTTVKHGTN